MPNWLVHIGSGLIFGEKLRNNDIKIFLIGTILPDISRLLLILSLDIFHFEEIFLLKYLEPLHTPAMMLLFSAGLSFLFISKRAFILLYSASIIHILLDTGQYVYGHSMLLLYPLSFKGFTLQLFHTGTLMSNIISIIFLIIMLYFLRIKSRFIIELKYIIPSIIFILLYLTIPLLTLNNVQDSGFHSLNFFIDPNGYPINKKVYFPYSRVISEEPPMVMECGNSFNLLFTEKTRVVNYRWPFTKEITGRNLLLGKQKLKKGWELCFSAINKGNYSVEIRELFINKTYMKVWFSIIGLIYLLIFLIKDGIELRYKGKRVFKIF